MCYNRETYQIKCDFKCIRMKYFYDINRNMIDMIYIKNCKQPLNFCRHATILALDFLLNFMPHNYLSYVKLSLDARLFDYLLR